MTVADASVGLMASGVTLLTPSPPWMITVIPSDERRRVVDAFARYRIEDPVREGRAPAGGGGEDPGGGEVDREMLEKLTERLRRPKE